MLLLSIQMDSQQPEAYFQLAQTFYALNGDAGKAAAADAIQRALALSPENKKYLEAQKFFLSKPHRLRPSQGGRMTERSLETLWPAIVKSRDLPELRAAIKVDRSVASAALADLNNLLGSLELLHASEVLDQLRWLGIELAGVSGDRGLCSRLTAQRQQKAALDAIGSGTSSGCKPVVGGCRRSSGRRCFR